MNPRGLFIAIFRLPVCVCLAQNVYTKKDFITSSNGFDKSGLQEVRWSGYTTANKLTSLDYSSPSQSNPASDYRSTIHWAPVVKTSGKIPATVKFYSGDAATNYRIVVEEVTAAGLPVRSEKVIEVVK